MQSVFIVDDHEMILPGLRMAVESLEGFKVVGQATDGLSAFNGIMELRPDIAILDLSVPIMNGYTIVRRLREERNGAKVIILTSFCEEYYVRQALELKVDAYVLKENASSELILALRSVSKGYRYLVPKVMTMVIEGLGPGGGTESAEGLGFDSLTARERDVLALVTQGQRGKEICSALSISESTLKTHKAALMRKLKVRSTNELIVLANRQAQSPEFSGRV